MSYMIPRERLYTESRNRLALPAAIVVFLVALSLRLIPFEHVFANGQVYYYDPDCYMRLRKILVYLTSFPATAIHDYFQGYPQGTGVITPPTMEYFMAALFFPMRSSEMLLPLLERVIAIIPPVLGAFTALILCRFTASMFGVYAGLTAGLVLAFTPAHMEATILGRFDNEMLEPLLLLLVFAGYLKSYHGGERLRTWLITGCLAALYLSVWRGGIAFLSLIGVDLLIRLWRDRHDRPQLKTYGRGAVCMYGVTAFLLALICLTDLWGSRMLFSFNIISWFHVLLFAGGAAIFYAFSCGLAKNLTTGLAYCAAVAVPLLLVLGGQLFAGISLVSGGNPWLDSIVQYQRFTDPAAFARGFGLFPLFLPFALYLLFTDELWRKLRERRFLVLWCLVMVVVTVGRQRYAEYFAINSALSAGVCVSWLLGRFPSQRAVVPALIVITLLLMQLPTYGDLLALKEQRAADLFRGDVEETMNWLREHTPVAGDPLRPGRKPSYGVMARWDYGGWIETVAQRPSVATNYGTETYGMDETARFFLSTDEKEMSDILGRNGVRYLLVDNVVTDLPMYAALINSKSDVLALQRDLQSGALSYVPTPKLYKLIISRLFYADGTAADAGSFRFDPVEGVRLQFESSSPADVNGLPWPVAKLKLYEVVSGARLMITAAPGSTVKVSQTVETNRSRRFAYRNAKSADQNGIAEFVISYPPRQDGSVGAVGPVSVEANGRHSAVTVTAADIDARRRIRVSP